MCGIVYMNENPAKNQLIFCRARCVSNSFFPAEQSL